MPQRPGDHKNKETPPLNRSGGVLTIGSPAIRTLAAFADEKNIRRLNRVAAARRNLDQSVIELVETARQIPDIPISSLAPAKNSPAVG
jgi:hypothetical protein